MERGRSTGEQVFVVVLFLFTVLLLVFDFLVRDVLDTSVCFRGVKGNSTTFT